MVRTLIASDHFKHETEIILTGIFSILGEAAFDVLKAGANCISPGALHRFFSVMTTLVRECRVVVWDAVHSGRLIHTAVIALKELSFQHNENGVFLADISSVCGFLLTTWAQAEPSVAGSDGGGGVALLNPWRKFQSDSLLLSQQEAKELSILFNNSDFLADILMDPGLLAEDSVFTLLCSQCWQNQSVSLRFIESIMLIVSTEVHSNGSFALLLGNNLVRVLSALNDDFHVQRMECIFHGAQTFLGLGAYLSHRNDMVRIFSWWSSLQLAKQFPFLSDLLSSFRADTAKWAFVMSTYKMCAHEQKVSGQDESVKHMCLDIIEDMHELFP